MEVHTGREAAFTVVELVVVMVITSVMAALTVPLLLHGPEQRLRPAAYQLAADLKLARDTAIATQRHTWVAFDRGNNSYRVYIESPTLSGRDHRIPLTDPRTGDAFYVTFNAGDFRGVTISTVSLGPEDEVEFNWSGSPCNGNGTLLASDGTIRLAADTARTVRVVADTGHVQEE